MFDIVLFFIGVNILRWKRLIFYLNSVEHIILWSLQFGKLIIIKIEIDFFQIIIFLIIFYFIVQVLNLNKQLLLLDFLICENLILQTNFLLSKWILLFSCIIFCLRWNQTFWIIMCIFIFNYFYIKIFE